MNPSNSTNTFSKILRLLLIATLSFLVTACSKDDEVKKTAVATYTTSSGAILETDRIMSVVEWKNAADVSFKAGWRIAEMKVSVGQAVKKWDVLALLWNEEANITMRWTSDILAWLASGSDVPSIRSSLEALSKSTAELYDSRISSAKNDVESAGIRLKLAQDESKLASRSYDDARSVLSGSVLSSAETQKQAEEALTLAKNQLDRTTELLDSEEDALYRASLSSLSNAFILARTAREYADTFLGISDENKSKNDGFENLLDTYEKNRAENLYHDFNTRYDATHAWYFANVAGKENVPRETVQEALNRAIPVMESLRDTLHSIKSVLEKTVAGTNLPQSSIDAYQLKTDEYLAHIETALISPSGGGLSGNRNGIDSFNRTRNLKLDSLKDAVTLAERNVSLAKIGKEVTGSRTKTDLDSLAVSTKAKQDAAILAEKSLDQAKKAVTLIESEKRAKLSEISGKIAELWTKVSEARMQSDLAKASAENGLIRAPFDGVILRKYADVGTVVSAGSPILRISSPDADKVVFSLNTEIFPLSVGSEVAIQEETTSYTGSVRNVSTVRDPLTDRYVVEVEVPHDRAKSGNRAWVVASQKWTAGILIPLHSIVTKYSIPSVYVVQSDSTVRLTPIRVIDSDMTYARVEGVQSGTVVVTDGKDTLLDGEPVNVR